MLCIFIPELHYYTKNLLPIIKHDKIEIVQIGPEGKLDTPLFKDPYIIMAKNNKAYTARQIIPNSQPSKRPATKPNFTSPPPTHFPLVTWNNIYRAPPRMIEPIKALKIILLSLLCTAFVS